MSKRPSSNNKQFGEGDLPTYGDKMLRVRCFNKQGRIFKCFIGENLTGGGWQP
jgi:hypothetical protein